MYDSWRSDMYFICPVCRRRLFLTDNSYKCANSHNFDVSSKGYVNLLLSSKKGANHGDNKMMVRARKNFLCKGYYDCLADEIVRQALKNIPDSPTILDAGCGEGYYTNLVQNAVGECKFFAVDISKDAAGQCSKKNEKIKCAVASVFDLPFENESFDLLMNVFSPFCKQEYERVLRHGGKFMSVIPSENHLFELKKMVYDNPYKNEVKDYHIDGFCLEDKSQVNSEIFLDNNEDIMNLFMMTPYYYKSGEKEQKRACECQNLKTQICFEILIYSKK